MAEEKKVRKMSTAKPKSQTAKKKTTKSKAPSTQAKSIPLYTAGDKQCYCYVSVNLTSNTRHGGIISIGAMTPDGDTFYAENTEYNMKDVTTDVFENVVKYLIGPNNTVFNPVVAPLGDIRDKFIEWLKSYYEPKQRFVQFVMDKVEWDWPIFKEFLAPEGVDMPTWISPLVSDLNGDLANAVSVTRDTIDSVINGEADYINFIPTMIVDKELDRVEVAEGTKNVIGTIMIANNENALKKAMCIRAIHQSRWGYNQGE